MGRQREVGVRMLESEPKRRRAGDGGMGDEHAF